MMQKKKNRTTPVIFQCFKNIGNFWNKLIILSRGGSSPPTFLLHPGFATNQQDTPKTNRLDQDSGRALCKYQYSSWAENLSESWNNDLPTSPMALGRHPFSLFSRLFSTVPRLEYLRHAHEVPCRLPILALIKSISTQSQWTPHFHRRNGSDILRRRFAEPGLQIGGSAR